MIISRVCFDRQPLFIRQGALRLWGVPLAHRSDVCQNRQLYSFNNFFAEVCYDKNDGSLTCVCTFTRIQRLAPYLEQVNVDKLVNLKPM
ncbi:hypothetical protein [Spirosoma fluviale]|uniref:Uncharacterized protein n=1 Tax=Spirosoma fluviale TaxID=1597977 RepID=A0A286GDL4_9BACT|nr:hypothetical protein [Spirosoma fluviale]SOD93114.1 hypothetical protein SAMN06269250_4362 [Spirosoma fluviale]